MLNAANGFIWGFVLTWLLIFTGVLLTVKTRFFQFRKFGKMLKNSINMFKKSDGVSPFEAMSAALSGTMGTGNIIGVGAVCSFCLMWDLIILRCPVRQERFRAEKPREYVWQPA